MKWTKLFSILGEMNFFFETNMGENRETCTIVVTDSIEDGESTKYYPLGRL